MRHTHSVKLFMMAIRGENAELKARFPDVLARLEQLEKMGADRK